MRYYKQRKIHDPENGQFGDCYATCLACLLDLEQDEVPEIGIHFNDGDKFSQVTRDFLKSKGYALFTMNINPLMSLDEVLEYLGILNSNCLYIFSGQSQRGINHAVIAHGGEIIHDPHPSNAFVERPCDFDKDHAGWLVEVIIPLSQTL